MVDFFCEKITAQFDPRKDANPNGQKLGDTSQMVGIVPWAVGAMTSQDDHGECGTVEGNVTSFGLTYHFSYFSSSKSGSREICAGSEPSYMLVAQVVSDFLKQNGPQYSSLCTLLATDAPSDDWEGHMSFWVEPAEQVQC